MVESEEAARRLGVKMATLYAYVSRGLLHSHRSTDPRRSLFDLDEVERLAMRQRGGRRVESRLASVTTSLTQLREDGPAYRGVSAVHLARTTPYEDVAELLWDTVPSPDSWERNLLPDPPQVSANDRMRWAVLMSGASDPFRSDLRPEAVTRVARTLVATMVAALPFSSAVSDGGSEESVAATLMNEGGTVRRNSVAQRLSARLMHDAPAQVVRAVNAALVLLADHELATSTLGVRVAASTHADLYDSLGAAMGVMAGPLHGGASQLAYELLTRAERDGVELAVGETLRWQALLPGFGHTVYKFGDPRTPVLLDLFDRLATSEQRDLVRSLTALAADHEIPAPNVDLGLAAITWATNMPADAGRTIFTVARVAGWTGHYLEELREKPLRFRSRAVYSSG
jgi:citrate synthase